MKTIAIIQIYLQVNASDSQGVFKCLSGLRYKKYAVV